MLLSILAFSYWWLSLALGNGQIMAGILCVIKSLIVPAPDLQRAISVCSNISSKYCKSFLFQNYNYFLLIDF